MKKRTEKVVYPKSKLKPGMIVDRFIVDAYKRFDGKRSQFFNGFPGKVEVTVKVVSLALMLVFWCQMSHASGIHDSLGVRAVMGEARGESLTGKTAVAEAIRNRGHLRGVYGVNVPMEELLKESRETWDQARRAWFTSENSSIVNGSDHWFSESDIKQLKKISPKWFKRLTFVKKIEHHYFYRDDYTKK